MLKRIARNHFNRLTGIHGWYRYQGFWIRTPPKSFVNQLNQNQIYELPSVTIIRGQVKKSQHCIDVGANIGLITLEFARCVGSAGKVTSFEPHPDNCSTLVDNIEANHFSSIVNAKQIGCSNKSVKGFLSSENQIGGSYRLESKENGSVQEVKCKPLDECIEMHSKVNFIKVDVEGHELQVLQGAKKILSDSDNLQLLIEFHPYQISLQKEYSASEIIDFILNYEFSLLDTGVGNKKVEKRELLDRYTIENRGITNLWCTRK
jgi:FkbM family methyltransferase